VEEAEVTAPQPEKSSSRPRKRRIPKLAAGTRVVLSAPDPALTLASPLGTIVGPDEDDGDLGYYIVKLDAPAVYDHGVGAPLELTTIIELIDNLQVMTDAVTFRTGHRLPIVTKGRNRFTPMIGGRAAASRTVGSQGRRARRKAT
jgi:hypothetical protein